MGFVNFSQLGWQQTEQDQLRSFVLPIWFGCKYSKTRRTRHQILDDAKDKKCDPETEVVFFFISREYLKAILCNSLRIAKILSFDLAIMVLMRTLFQTHFKYFFKMYFIFCYRSTLKMEGVLCYLSLIISSNW